jgi:hypothetical protein
MQTHYIFVDYENTPPGNIGLISENLGNIKIKIYLGRHQNMIPVSMARALHALGQDAEYIQLDSARRNTMDFNIAFQIGELATQHPEAQFSILSNDPGFNVIVESMRSKGVACARYADMDTLIVQWQAIVPSNQEPAREKENKVLAKVENINKPHSIVAENGAQLKALH